METPFWGRSLHSLSPSSPQGVFTHSRFGFLVSITEQKTLGFSSPLPQTRSALLFSELFSLLLLVLFFSPGLSCPFFLDLPFGSPLPFFPPKEPS
ncbi:hypothetical protein TNCV_604651 [Trichonephila clavipes]|nr:hypothetical protein TNCV_604651 [Trichonephila clavipes]